MTTAPAIPRPLTTDLEGPVTYLDFGGSGPPMVLVHGLGGAALNWLAAGPLLAQSHHVYAVDLPGFGRTPLRSRRPTIPGFRSCVARFIEQVVGEPCVLVGSSMGSLVAMAVAAAHPNLVRSLVLASAALPYPKGQPRRWGALLPFFLYLTPGAGALYLRARKARLTPEEEIDQVLRHFAVDPTRIPPHVIDAQVALSTERRSMPWAVEAFVRAARSTMLTVAFPADLYRWEAAVTAPTLVLHGAKDRVSPIAAANALCKRRTDFAFAAIEGVGHVPEREAPNAFAEAIGSFLERTADRSAHL